MHRFKKFKITPIDAVPGWIEALHSKFVTEYETAFFTLNNSLSTTVGLFSCIRLFRGHASYIGSYKADTKEQEFRMFSTLNSTGSMSSIPAVQVPVLDLRTMESEKKLKLLVP